MTRALSEREHRLMVDATEDLWDKYRDQLEAINHDANLFSRVVYDFDSLIKARARELGLSCLPEGEAAPFKHARDAARSAQTHAEERLRYLTGVRDSEESYAVFLAGEREGFRKAVVWLSRMAADPATAAMSFLSAMHLVTADDGIDSLVTAEALRDDAEFPHVADDEENEKPADQWEDFREHPGVRIIDDKILIFGEQAICVPGAARVMLPFPIHGLTARYEPEEDRLLVAFRKKFLTKVRVAGMIKEDHKDPYLSFYWGNAGKVLTGFSISPFTDGKRRGWHNVSDRLAEVLISSVIIRPSQDPEEPEVLAEEVEV